MNPIELRRLDPARNMFRFYQLAIEPDLFGGFRLLRQWGRIGGRGEAAASVTRNGLIPAVPHLRILRHLMATILAVLKRNRAMKHELLGKEARALAAIRRAHGVEEAAGIWQEKYERPGVPASAVRRRAARRIYEKVSDASDTPLYPRHGESWEQFNRRQFEYYNGNRHVPEPPDPGHLYALSTAGPHLAALRNGGNYNYHHGGNSSEVHVGHIEIKPPSGNADDIAKSIGPAIKRNMFAMAANFGSA